MAYKQHEYIRVGLRTYQHPCMVNAVCFYIIPNMLVRFQRNLVLLSRFLRNIPILNCLTVCRVEPEMLRSERQMWRGKYSNFVCLKLWSDLLLSFHRHMWFPVTTACRVIRSEWKKDNQYGGLLRVYWIYFRGQTTRGGSPALGFEQGGNKSST